MWLFIEPFAIEKRVCPPPAPRSFAANRGRLIASATKFVSSSSPFCSPLLAKYSGSPRPGLELHAVQVLHIEGADDVEAFVAHPARVGRFLLGGELVGEFLRDGGGFHSS